MRAQLHAYAFLSNEAIEADYTPILFVLQTVPSKVCTNIILQQIVRQAADALASAVRYVAVADLGHHAERVGEVVAGIARLAAILIVGVAVVQVEASAGYQRRQKGTFCANQTGVIHPLAEGN